MVAVLYATCCTEYNHPRCPEEPPDSQQSRGTVPVSGVLDTMSINCTPGPLKPAPSCDPAPGSLGQSQAKWPSTPHFQHESQEHNTLIAMLQTKLAFSISFPLVLLRVSPAVAQESMILGGVQQQVYVYICMNQGQTIWGHVDIVQVLMTDPAGQPLSGLGDAL